MDAILLTEREYSRLIKAPHDFMFMQCPSSDYRLPVSRGILVQSVCCGALVCSLTGGVSRV